MDDEPSVDSDPNSSLLRSERGAAWLRDQNLRTIKSTLGALPEPSDGASLHPGSDVDDKDLSLQKGPGGKYYYQYNSTAGSSSISSFDSGYDENLSVEGDGTRYRPTSMEVAWLDSQRQGANTPPARRPPLPGSTNSDPTPMRDLGKLYPDIPADVLPFISSASLPPPTELTSCSECGLILDTIRYVCSTCKEKRPRTREELESPMGRGKQSDQFSYPPSGGRQDLQVGSSHCGGFKDMFKLSLPDGRSDPGYELCPSCLESAGVHHALEKSLDPGSSPSPASPEHALSAWRRTAPKQKGKLRHAYVEKSWGWGGWQDVRAYCIIGCADPQLAYPRLQNKTTEQTVGALHVATFSWAGGISVPLAYSSIFAGRAIGGSILWGSFSTIAEAAHSSVLPARSTRYTPPTLSWMSSMDGLQDRGATAIQTSWPIIHLLWKILLPNVSNAFFVYKFSQSCGSVFG